MLDYNKKSLNNNLLYYKQFILGPDYHPAHSKWNKVDLKNGLYLTAHPDLPIHQSKNADQSIILLGYILDPFNNEASDQDIIDGLIAGFTIDSSLDSLFERTVSFGGRWILIVDNGAEVILFHDPTGYRQVHYSDINQCDVIWCASQPKLLSGILNLEIAEDAQEFINSKFTKDSQHWWPVDSSPYSEIRRLLPNNYLNLSTGKKVRYWPNKPLVRREFDDAIQENLLLLQGMMKSALNRFDLALSITAGKDTRLLLAASKGFQDKLYYFTGLYLTLTEKSWDITIPQRLLSKSNLIQHIIKCPKDMSDSFRKFFTNNVQFAREVYGIIAEGLYNHFPNEKVAIKGNAIPVIRPLIRNRLRALGKSDTEEITGHDISLLTGIGGFNMKNSSFAVNAYDRWLSELGETYNVDILNMIHWEDVEGSWQAMSQLEWDPVHEIFVPFNCRSFLVNFLSVDEKYRDGPDFQCHTEMIRQLWPELLKVPFNPKFNPKNERAALAFMATKRFLEDNKIDKLIPEKIRSLGRTLFRLR